MAGGPRRNTPPSGWSHHRRHLYAQAVRQWVRDQGLRISDMGPLPVAMIEAYDAEQARKAREAETDQEA